jgi:c-di-GMP-binding flagellar brake protein YcgR
MGITTRFYDTERRDFIRVRAELPVKYRFLSSEPGLVTDEVFVGSTSNISGGGLLLVGEIPNADWISALLMERIAVGVSLELPGDPDPVEALTRAGWVEALDERARRCSLGLRFKEITREDLDRIFRYVIGAQMP